MRVKFRDLWTWDGVLNRSTYALIGVVGFAIKHNLDRVVASAGFKRPWALFNYWIPLNKAIRITSLSPGDARFLLTMVVISLPFIWVGIVCTLKRLRDASLSPAWVIGFFLPFVNLLFFIACCLIPSRIQPVAAPAIPSKSAPGGIGAWIPKSKIGSASLAALSTGIVGYAIGYFSMDVLTQYGWGLFVALPFCMGFVAVLLYGFHEPRSLGSSITVSCVTVGVLAALLLALGAEGAICILMAAPLGLPLAMLGGIVAWLIQSRSGARTPAPAVFSALLLFVPAVMGVEQASHLVPPVYAVQSSVEIEAPPETVWKQVVAFAQIPEPRELLFRAGIAYPIRAEIVGQGPGGERRCIFSTGAFVEPIQIWDEPHLLKFSVTSNPEPMQEWSPYSRFETPHLHGFLVSQGGQFLLTALPGGRTRLEGTTWYRHTMWPATYWRLWSDHIIHQIHMRVLDHIKTNTEQQFVHTTLR
jgi:uncharacterized membrane protein YhaH (DUF805 family)